MSVVAGWWLLVLSCTGTLGAPEDVEGPGAAASGAVDTDGDGVPDSPGAPAQGDASGAQPTGRPADEAGYGDDSDGLSDTPAPTTRTYRLTHEQWANTVHDLFGLEDTQIDELQAFLRADPVQSGFAFDNQATALAVDEALYGGYQRAAAEIARLVTGDAQRLAAIAPADDPDPRARAARFIEDFGQRVHRRPLEPQMVDEYLALYDAGAPLYPDASGFEAGVRLVLEAMLQSPYFLYRVEDSSEQVGDVIPLDSWEVGSRLSYLLWNTMPDDALFAAAEAGELTRAETVETHARRMLADARAEATVQRFHAQLFDVEHYLDIEPSEAFFPGAPGDLGELAQREHELFVREVLFEGDGSYGDLLTSTTTFVNDDLARIYGLTGSFGDELVRAELDPAERRGLLTHVGFLASNATSANPDPIHRGVFVARRIACAPIAAPPADIPPLPAPMGRTNREVIEDHTEDPDTVCASCHSTIINPFGFPFESYDATGAYRTEDNGQPVDTQAMPLVGGSATPVADAVELIDALAGDRNVHECYTKSWLEYAYGRSRAPEDDPLLARLAESSVRGAAVKELLVGLVRTEAFLTRSTEELP